MIIHSVDKRPHAGGRGEDVPDQREINVVMGAGVARGVHQLNGEVDARRGRIGPVGGHDVLLAQDRRGALDEEAGALLLIGDDGFADDDPLAGLEFDFKGHRVLRGLERFPAKHAPDWMRGGNRFAVENATKQEIRAAMLPRYR